MKPKYTISELYSRPSETPTGDHIIDAVVATIRQKPSIWAKDVAKSLGVSRRDLSASVKLLVGTSLDEVVKEWRMLQAMEQIKCTDLDFLTIARQCGYSNTRHLSFAMEQRLHMTPYEYRYGAHRNDIRRYRRQHPS